MTLKFSTFILLSIWLVSCHKIEPTDPPVLTLLSVNGDGNEAINNTDTANAGDTYAFQIQIEAEAGIKRLFLAKGCSDAIDAETSPEISSIGDFESLKNENLAFYNFTYSVDYNELCSNVMSTNLYPLQIGVEDNEGRVAFKSYKFYQL